MLVGLKCTWLNIHYVTMCMYVYIYIYIYIYIGVSICKLYMTCPFFFSGQTHNLGLRHIKSPFFITMKYNMPNISQYDHLAVCQNLVPLVNIKIAGKWMFIPLKMVLIGIDPYPFVFFWVCSIFNPIAAKKLEKSTSQPSRCPKRGNGPAPKQAARERQRSREERKKHQAWRNFCGV